MKCPYCGTENLSTSKSCARCGRPLGRIISETRDPAKARLAFQSGPTRIMNDRSRDLNEKLTAEDVASKMKMDYKRCAMDQSMKVLDGFQTLLASLRKKDIDLKGLMEKAAKTIQQQFRIRWVAIGLKSHADDKFRYEVLAGFKNDAAEARKKQVFELSDFFEDKKYKGRMISEYTKLFLEEDRPFTEGAEITFNRPMLMNSKRREMDDALEADYLDVNIYGINNELNGWIEMSGTIMGKLPDAPTMRAIEVIAEIIGEAVMRVQNNRYGK